MKKVRTAAFIPLRQGSKSIPLKNIKEIAGKPLAFWTIESALRCSSIDKVFVSTDSDVIAEVIRGIKNEKLSVIGRSGETATDTASTESALIEFAEKYPEYEHIVLIQATSPLLEAEDLDSAIESFNKGAYDSFLSVVRQKRFIWGNDKGRLHSVNYNYLKRPRRQEFDGFLVENGAFYIMTRSGLLEHTNRLFGKVGAYEMAEETYFELDEESDWVVIEKLLIKRKKRKIDGVLNKIKMVVFDVDGVFTDGGVYVDENGNEQVKFSRIDGKGIELLRERGFYIAVISAEDSDIVRRRMEKLNIPEVHLGIKDKLKCLNKLVEKYTLQTTEVCFCGDDVQDIISMKAMGLSICPSNAVAEVKEISSYISEKTGGDGFVREVCDLLLSKRKIKNSEGK